MHRGRGTDEGGRGVVWYCGCLVDRLVCFPSVGLIYSGRLLAVWVGALVMWLTASPIGYEIGYVIGFVVPYLRHSHLKRRLIGPVVRGVRLHDKLEFQQPNVCPNSFVHS